MTEAQKRKKMEKETNRIDKISIITITAVLVICLIVGISIGKILYDLAIASA